MIERLRSGQPSAEERLDALLAAVDRPTELIGRESDLVAVASRLRPGRLVTVCGPGGVGKTALADTVADCVAHLFDDHWRCRLAAADDRAAFDAIIARTLGTFRTHDASVFDAVVDALRGRRALLVLDNVEQVVGAAATAVGVLLDECPGLTVVATSRIALGLEQEDVWALAPLNSQSGAPELFGRLTDGDPERAPGALAEPHHDGAVSSICRELDGIPLALKLAAARTTELSVGQIAEHLDQRFRVARDLDTTDRQVTLTTAMRWAYDGLDSTDRQLFDRASVFHGSFDLVGASAVLGAQASRFDVPAMLDRLTAASMIARHDEAGRQRYRVPETLRQFGDRQLAERGERATVRNAHLDHVVGVTAAAAARCHGPDWSDGLADARLDWANIRSAVQWGIDTQRHVDVDRLLRDLYFVSVWTIETEPAEWARRTLDRAQVTDADPGAPAHLHLGHGLALGGDHEAAMASYDRAVAASATPTDRSWARHFAAVELMHLGRVDAAAAVVDEMLLNAPPHVVEQAIQGSSRAVLLSVAGRMSHDEASRIVDAMREFAERSESPVAIGSVLHQSAVVQELRGDASGAAATFGDVARLAHRHGIPKLASDVVRRQVAVPGRVGLSTALDAVRKWPEERDIGNELAVLEGAAINLAELGRSEPAGVIFGFLDRTDRRPDASGRRRHDAVLRRRDDAVTTIGASRKSSRWARRGREMSFAEVTDYARSTLEPIVAML